jgi:AcrR family transcriptional regulator
MAATGLGRGRVAAGRDDHLTAGEITRTALAIVDAQGIDGLTMRRLADEVNVSPRALYHHFSGKAAVLEGVVSMVWDNAINDFLPIDPQLPAIEVIIQGCIAVREAFRAHVDVALYAAAVVAPGNRLAAAATVMGDLFVDAGFPDVTLAASVLQTYTFGSVAVTATRERADRYFGRDPDELANWVQRRAADATADDSSLAIYGAVLPETVDVVFERGLRACVTGLLASDRAEAGLRG